MHGVTYTLATFSQIPLSEPQYLRMRIASVIIFLLATLPAVASYLILVNKIKFFENRPAFLLLLSSAFFSFLLYMFAILFNSEYFPMSVFLFRLECDTMPSIIISIFVAVFLIIPYYEIKFHVMRVCEKKKQSAQQINNN